MTERPEIPTVAPTDDDPEIINPLNGVAMVKLQIGNVKIDRCPKTGAIWLDQGELAQLALLDAKQKALLKQLDKPFPGVATPNVQRAGRGPLQSPRTGALMMVVNDPRQKHVEFEVDPQSGGCFFDAGELSDLTEYTFRERLRTFLG